MNPTEEIIQLQERIHSLDAEMRMREFRIKHPPHRCSNPDVWRAVEEYAFNEARSLRYGAFLRLRTLRAQLEFNFQEPSQLQLAV